MPAEVTLDYGCRKALPDGVRAAWGARLIAPADLVWDRQGGMAVDGGDCGPLMEWLNGDRAGTTGAMAKALATATRLRLGTGAAWELNHGPGSEHVVVLFRDSKGMVVGSPQGSHGYVYVAAWLFTDACRFVAESGDPVRLCDAMDSEVCAGCQLRMRVTETGRLLTDGDIERLAAEAEEGHPDARVS